MPAIGYHILEYVQQTERASSTQLQSAFDHSAVLNTIPSHVIEDVVETRVYCSTAEKARRANALVSGQITDRSGKNPRLEMLSRAAELTTR